MGSSKGGLSNGQCFRQFKPPNTPELHPEATWPLRDTQPGKDSDKKEAEKPSALLGAHRQKCHRDRVLCTFGQLSLNQIQRTLALSWVRVSFNFIPPPLVCVEQLLMSSIDCWILRRSPQSLTRQPYVVSGAEVSVLGVDVDGISAYSLRVAAMLLLVLLGSAPIRKEVHSRCCAQHLMNPTPSRWSWASGLGKDSHRDPDLVQRIERPAPGRG